VFLLHKNWDGGLRTAYLARDFPPWTWTNPARFGYGQTLRGFNARQRFRWIKSEAYPCP